VLFAHWSFPPEVVAARLPPGLMLDTHDGRAWVSAVALRMHDVHLRGLPGLPGSRSFPELNLRTYVTVGETHGVYFFSLDATSRLVVALARRWFALPYLRAEMLHRVDEAGVRFESERTDTRAAPAQFSARYAPSGPVALATRGSLDHWLTERYALFAVRPDGRVLRGDVQHPPWPLQPVVADLSRNTLLLAAGLPADEPPAALHYAARVDVPTWAPRVVYRPEAGRRT